MICLFDQHRDLLEEARAASKTRGFWTPFSEVPSTSVYGETAKKDGLAAFEARLGQPFELPGHRENMRVGAEVSPWGPELRISYPVTDAQALVAASAAAAPAWAAATPEARVGICLEALMGLNRRSFEMANAVIHTTG